MKSNRVDKLLTLAYMIADEYHEDFFDSKTEEVYPRLFEQVIKHDAYDKFGIEDLNSVEVGFVMKMSRDIVFKKINEN